MMSRENHLLAAPPPIWKRAREKGRECVKWAHIEKVTIMGSNGKDGHDGALSFEHST